MNKIKKTKIYIPVIGIAISLILIAYVNIFVHSNNMESYNKFLDDLNSGNVVSVNMDSTDTMDIKTKDGTKYSTDNPRTETLKENLLKQNVIVKENKSVSPVETALGLVFLCSVISLGITAIKTSKISSKSMLKVDAIEAHNLDSFKFSFKSFAGNEEAKESLQDVVDFLKNPEKYASYGARMPKGVILYGSPGTGKTLLAKAVAGEAKVPFYAISASDFIQMYVGVGASRIRNLFKKAKAHGKAVIFIDEIDAIGKKRSSSKNGGSDERDQTLNALLTEMSGFNDHNGIVVIAATNRLDMLDDALLRPGRFDRHVEVALPDVAAREDILRLYLKNKPCEDIDIKTLAKKCTYFSGAKLESLINEAAILACKDQKPYINEEHIEKAFSRVVAGHEKINRDSLSHEDLKITAYHEAGHALISKLMLPCDNVSKITIIPTSNGAGGYTLTIPKDTNYQTLDYLNKRLMVMLGGRAAEEIIFGSDKVTTGAFNDLKTATSLVTAMITQYGMGESLGLLNLSEIQNSSSISSQDVVTESREKLLSLYNEAKDILVAHLSTLNLIAEELSDKETLMEEELERLLST